MYNKVKQRQRIGIDARFYGPLGKGLGRYVQEVVDNLIKLNEDKDGEFEYVIFLSPDNFDQFNVVSSFVEKRMISLPWYSWKEQLFFPALIKKAKIDLMHFPHFNVPILSSVPFVVTIHDLILTRFPSRRASMLPATLYWLKQLAYRLVIQRALKKARKVITVSEFTRQDILNKFKTKLDKIVVTYEGVSKLETQNIRVESERDVLFKYGVAKPFALYVGNAYPHKNLEFLLLGFKSLYNKYPELSLVMVGKEDYFYQRLKKQAKDLNQNLKPGKGPLFIFPGYVSDSDLAIFYKEALFYIFPSLYEGFGLPPLEAMSYGCPVLSSNQASLPEIMAEAALYFNPYETEDMIEKIDTIINKDDLRNQLKERGYQNIKRFSWSACALQTLDVYRKALSKN